MTGPLKGIRVLDLTTVVAGPTATMILADLGAEVIKVERPDGGDDSRHLGPHQGSWGAYFVALNRGKRSLAVDLRQPEGRDLVLRLARRSDVFIENFRGGKAAAFGLDETAVRAVRPDIIYASLTAYGPQGPEYEKPGYDALLQGRTGIISVTGAPECPPTRAGVSILDMSSGTWLAVGIIAALFERERSGLGQRVDSSLFQAGTMLMGYHLLYRQFTGEDPKPQGIRHSSFTPYGDFPTADGTILLGVANDGLFARLCKAVERPDWIKDSRFSTNYDRLQSRAQLDRELAQILRKHSTEIWLRKFDEHGVPASAVCTAGQLLDDPQLAAIEQLEDVELPGTQRVSVRVPRLPINLSNTPTSIYGPPPRLGEHGPEVLREAGFSKKEIADLADQGIIRLSDV